MKKCSRCKEEKPYTEFTKLSSSKDGYRYACRSCVSSYYHKNKETIRLSIKDCDLKRMYGITIDEYNDLAAEQENKCAICNENAKINLAVDHCHETGKVRGLLCYRCNMGLGYFRDNVMFLTKACMYLSSSNKAVEEVFGRELPGDTQTEE